MKVARSAGDVLAEHATLELECIDRMYLNVYVPMLQSGAGTSHFFRKVRGNPVPSSALMEPMTRRFVAALRRFARDDGIDVVRFERKDDRTQEYLRRSDGGEGVLHIGVAQEKARALRTERRHDPVRGPHPWLAPSTAMANHDYVYAVDDDFGPFFLKFRSYFPYNAGLRVNGREYLERRLAKEGIAFEALDNGIPGCADPARMQARADGLDAAGIDALLRKWPARLPHPFTGADRAAGIRYDISVLQAEFAPTRVLDRPVRGRVLFEEIIRENVDPGRPDHGAGATEVALIFDGRVTKRTPSRHRTRVTTEGVTPSLHVDHKHSRIGSRRVASDATTRRAAHCGPKGWSTTPCPRRTGNDIRCRQTAEEPRGPEGHRLCRRPTPAARPTHRPRLPNRRATVRRPPPTASSTASAPRRCASAVPACRPCSPRSCTSGCCPKASATRDLRELVAPLPGLPTAEYGRGRMSYDLRRLRLHGLIERIPPTRRCRVADAGLRTALCYNRICARVLRPTPSVVFDRSRANARINGAIESFDREMQHLREGRQLAA